MKKERCRVVSYAAWRCENVPEREEVLDFLIIRRRIDVLDVNRVGRHVCGLRGISVIRVRLMS